MKTEHYISQLLYRYQCVTVPGFGAFLTEIQSAQHFESANTFFPPKKLISFNANLKNNDGLLANHIAQAQKISYENAIELISNDVASWRNSLHIEGQLILKNIGQLFINSESNLVFAPSEETNYLKESFGLTSFVSPTVKREVYKEQVEALEEKLPIQFTPEKRSGNSFLKYAAIFTGVLLLAGSVGYKLFTDQVAENTLLVENQVQQEITTKIQEATFFIGSPLPSVTLPVKEETLGFHIVAGVYRSEDNADTALEDLKKLGFEARRIPPTRTHLYPVVYGSYSTQREAAQELQSIRKNQDKHAWILAKEY